MADRRRIGIFGWGVVAPRSADVAAFERNLGQATSWLEPFDGFGPSNFLVGKPEFDFEVYRPWIDARFEPRRYAQVNSKSGRTVKYAIGAFIQALGQNPGLERELQDLGPQAHVYVGTCLGDFPLQHQASLAYDRAQRDWNRFWCRAEHHPKLADYRSANAAARERRRTELGAPPDPADFAPEEQGHEARVDAWLAFWLELSEGLEKYLEELRQIESEGIVGDVESEKGNIIRRKLAARKRLNARWSCPLEPWNSVDAQLLWNIPNIPASQITMLGQITGPSFAPIAACAGFGTALKLADMAIQQGEARAVVVGMTDPEPHPLSVGAFFNARVVSHDGEVSKPFTAMRGTHISGGACVWIVGDADYLIAQGMKPLGLEILGVALSSDADHIITPSADGPRRAIRGALTEAGVEPSEIATWDMHATATPGDWTELQNALALFGSSAVLTARKGSFGHGMSVCGGWELTAQHMGFANGILHPVNLDGQELHPQIAPYHECLLQREHAHLEGEVAGKINMGIGGVNACVICRRWET
jgi:hypothetical protein